MAVRVALLTPFASPSVRGNAVTVGRIARALVERGVTLRVWDLSATADARVEREVQAFGADVIHACHAYRVGPLGLRIARTTALPLVVTITGTDGNHDLFDPARAAAVREVLGAAAAITVFHGSMGARLEQGMPGVGPRVHVVPQSVAFEPAPRGATSMAQATVDGNPLLLLPAGIRPVKGPLVPLEPLGRLLPRFPGLRLVYAGPVLDRDEGAALERALVSRPWARHIGAVPHHAMRALIERADLVLNCSLSEGGMANSVLEALALGRAVLASAIDGNRSLIEDGVTGMLYADGDELGAKAARLCADPELRRRLGAAGRTLVTTRYGPRSEIEGYLAVYAHVRSRERIDVT